MKPNNILKLNLNETTTTTKFKQIGINEIFIVGSALLIIMCGIYPEWLFNLVSFAEYLIPQ